MPANPSTTDPRIRLGFEGFMGLFASAILLFGAVLWSARGPNVEKTDFSLTYVGARIVHEGHGARLYDMRLQNQVRDSTFAHPNPLLFEHPPFEAFVLAPLAALPFRTAYLLWGFFNAGVWLVLIYFLRPCLPRPREDLGYISLWLLFAPLGVALFQGQPSILLLAIFALTFVNLRHQNELAAGFFLGLGLFRFQFVLPFAFIFLMRKKWRFLGGFGVTASLLGAMSLIAVGRSGVKSYIHFLLNIANNPENLSYGSGTDMPTIHGFVFAVLGPSVGHLGINITVAVLSLGLLIFVAHRWRTSSGASQTLMFAAAIPASLLSGSHMFTHDFSPLLLAMLLAYADFPAMLHSGLRWALGATLAIFWIFPVYFLFVAWHCMYLLCPVLLLFTFSVIFAGRRASDQPFTAATAI
jgi:hypothetical protein